MSDSINGLQRTITSATELHSVVRTMKAIAAASITQYDNAVQALTSYDHAVRLGLCACFRQLTDGSMADSAVASRQHGQQIKAVAIVFGSDQGLVGQFNETMAEFVVAEADALPDAMTVWTVGERVQSRLQEVGLTAVSGFQLPKTLQTIAQLLEEILRELEQQRRNRQLDKVLLFHNQPGAGTGYQPVRQQLLPLDANWRKQLTTIPWPTDNIPEVLGSSSNTLIALVREYLFVTLFKACAETLASENASRLTTMQRAEKNIEDLLATKQSQYHRLRQNSIDEELFDVVSGFEALLAE